MAKDETPAAFAQTAADVRPATSARGALTSAATDDWGTPEVGRRFAACVLRPAAREPDKCPIDLDASSSAYWQEQWTAAHRPRAFFDGSPGRDVLKLEDWEAELVRQEGIGSAFNNPPGEGSGLRVQDCYYALFGLWLAKKIDSVFWNGFNLDHLRSLIPTKAEHEKGYRGPMAIAGEKSITVFPMRRIAYMCHPDHMIKIIDKRLERPTKERARLEKRRLELTTRADDSPVVGPAPTHASYFTILWSHDRNKRRRQQKAAREFLAGQAELEKSVLHRYELVGDIGA